MKIRSLVVVSLIALFHWGCGGTAGVSSGSSSGTGSGSGDTTLSTVVNAPVSASASVGQSLKSVIPAEAGIQPISVSKSISVGKAEESNIQVAKVATAESAASNATCKCLKPDGTLLATGKSDLAGKVEVKIDASSMDLTAGVVWDCAIGSMNLKSLCSSASAVSSGGSVLCDAVSSSSTVALVNVLKAAGFSEIGPGFSQKVADGSIKPRAVFKSIVSQLDGSASAGDSSMVGMMKAIKEAWSSCFVSGGPACAPEQFIGGLIDGDSSAVNAAKGFVSGIDFGNAKALCGTGVATMAKTLSDSSFLSSGHSKFGDEFFSNQGKFFGNFGTTEVSGKPEILRGYMEQNFGSASAFQQAMTNAGAARAVGVMATKFDASIFTGKFDVMDKLIESSLDNLNSNVTDFSKFQQIAEGFGHQVDAVTDSTRTMVLNNPAAFTDKIFDQPGAYVGSGATTLFTNQFFYFGQLGATAFALQDGCKVDADCGSGKTCNTVGGMCVSSCSSACPPSAPCTSNGVCSSNVCTNGFCDIDRVAASSGGTDYYSIQMHGPGGSCSFTYQCYPPLTCSSGTCSSYSNWGGITAASGLQQASAGDSQVVLNFTTASGATGYRVYRSSSLAGTYSLIATLGNVTTYTNTGLTNGTQYFYKISSFTSMGESALSSAIGAIPLAGATGFAATAGNTQVVLNWSATSGATGYKIYQSLSSGGVYSLASTVGAVTTATISSLVNGTQYFFKIAPIVSSVEAELSSAVNATPVNPLTQQAYVKASNAEATDAFGGGSSVAISGDTLVVGVTTEDSNATGINGNQSDNSLSNSGAVYVFTRSGITWTQQAYIKASNTGANDFFGGSVAISGDTLVVGATGEASNATGINGDQSNNAGNSGAAYVFTRSGTTWTQQAYIKASNTEINDDFGRSVAISGDTLVVSTKTEDSNATGINGNQSDNSVADSGAVYVFTRSGTTWTQQAYIKASNTAASDFFGNSVAISGDTLAVSANLEDSNATGINGNQSDNSASSSGAVYVFTRSGITWTQQAYVKASNTEASDFFGGSVAISGESLVVSATGEDSNATGIGGNQSDNSVLSGGAVYVFTRSGITWTQQAYIKASNTEASDFFGGSVAISGESLVVGASGEDSNATGIGGNQSDNSALTSGAAYLFTRSGGTTWSQQAYIKASNAESNDSSGGFSVSISGNTLVLGARGEDSNATGINGNQSDNSATDSGAAYIFAP